MLETTLWKLCLQYSFCYIITRLFTMQHRTVRAVQRFLPRNLSVSRQPRLFGFRFSDIRKRSSNSTRNVRALLYSVPCSAAQCRTAISPDYHTQRHVVFETSSQIGWQQHFKHALFWFWNQTGNQSDKTRPSKNISIAMAASRLTDAHIIIGDHCVVYEPFLVYVSSRTIFVIILNCLV